MTGFAFAEWLIGDQESGLRQRSSAVLLPWLGIPGGCFTRGRLLLLLPANLSTKLYWAADSKVWPLSITSSPLFGGLS